MNGERRRSQEEAGERMPAQLDVVRQVMLLAAQYDSWMTLEELARKRNFRSQAFRRSCVICGRRRMGRLRWRSEDG